MSDIPSVKKFVQIEGTYDRKPVSQDLMQTIGGSTNFALDTLGVNYQFKLNGAYQSAKNKTSLDGFLIFDWDAEIFEVQMYSYTPGSTGTTTFDVQYSATRNGPFTSIFSTLPSISYNATHPTYVGVGDTVTNCVAPVLTSLPFQVVKGGWLKCDCTDTQSGGSRNAGIIIKYTPR